MNDLTYWVCSECGGEEILSLGERVLWHTCPKPIQRVREFVRLRQIQSKHGQFDDEIHQVVADGRAATLLLSDLRALVEEKP
jgi:hypothetical protein